MQPSRRSSSIFLKPRSNKNLQTPKSSTSSNHQEVKRVAQQIHFASRDPKAECIKRCKPRKLLAYIPFSPVLSTPRHQPIRIIHTKRHAAVKKSARDAVALKRSDFKNPSRRLPSNPILFFFLSCLIEMTLFPKIPNSLSHFSTSFPHTGIRKFPHQ